MLDTPLPQGPDLTTDDKIKFHLQNLQREGIRYPIDWVKDRLAWRQVVRRRRLGIVDESEDGSLHSSEIEAAFYRVIARYQVRHHPGTISLFRPKLNPTHVFGEGRIIDRDKRFIYEDNGWTPHCGPRRRLRDAGRPRLDGARAQRAGAGREDAGRSSAAEHTAMSLSARAGS